MLCIKEMPPLVVKTRGGRRLRLFHRQDAGLIAAQLQRSDEAGCHEGKGATSNGKSGLLGRRSDDFRHKEPFFSRHKIVRGGIYTRKYPSRQTADITAVREVRFRKTPTVPLSELPVDIS